MSKTPSSSHVPTINTLYRNFRGYNDFFSLTSQDKQSMEKIPVSDETRSFNNRLRLQDRSILLKPGNISADLKAKKAKKNLNVKLIMKEMKTRRQLEENVMQNDYVFDEFLCEESDEPTNEGINEDCILDETSKLNKTALFLEASNPRKGIRFFKNEHLFPEGRIPAIQQWKPTLNLWDIVSSSDKSLEKVTLLTELYTQNSTNGDGILEGFHPSKKAKGFLATKKKIQQLEEKLKEFRENIKDQKDLNQTMKQHQLEFVITDASAGTDRKHLNHIKLSHHSPNHWEGKVTENDKLRVADVGILSEQQLCQVFGGTSSQRRIGLVDFRRGVTKTNSTELLDLRGGSLPAKMSFAASLYVMKRRETMEGAKQKLRENLTQKFAKIPKPEIWCVSPTNNRKNNRSVPKYYNEWYIPKKHWATQRNETLENTESNETFKHSDELRKDRGYLYNHLHDVYFDSKVNSNPLAPKIEVEGTQSTRRFKTIQAELARAPMIRLFKKNLLENERRPPKFLEILGKDMNK